MSETLVDWRRLPLLPAAATARLDARTVASGTSSAQLMERAGRAVTRAITSRHAPQPALVLCGPGSNGGDGWVVARRLDAMGWPVRVATLDPRRPAQGDALRMRDAYGGPVVEATPAIVGPERVIVDGLFGVGLDRPLEGMAAQLAQAVNAWGGNVVAIDMPSGIDADTGRIRGDEAGGVAFRASLTVTFGTAKPGHRLFPGRAHTGELVVADIGIDPAGIAAEIATTQVNHPASWGADLPRRAATGHKYGAGHAVVLGGPATSGGASRLCATAALRSGAGLVTLLAFAAELPGYAAHLTAVMVKPCPRPAGLPAFLRARRASVAVLGPAAGVGPETLARVEALLAWGGPLLLDADALTVVAGPLASGRLALRDDIVLTPHDGELARLVQVEGDRLTRARAAASRLGSIVLLKGADTVVAAPDGRATILDAAPPSLATAGAGDVLAGLIGGLMAQGMPPFAAASAGAYLHAVAAARLGPRITAEDLLPALPDAMAAAIP